MNLSIYHHIHHFLLFSHYQFTFFLVFNDFMGAKDDERKERRRKGKEEEKVEGHSPQEPTRAIPSIPDEEAVTANLHP